jgi:hypothetical protein
MISVVRPAGKPPPVISSNPWIPVGAFRMGASPALAGRLDSAASTFEVVIKTNECFSR